MKNKKIILSIILVVLFLLTMSTTILAANVGKVYNLNAQMNGNKIYLSWSAVSNAKGYNIYVNNTRIGYVYSNQAALIGFTEGATYKFKVAAFDNQNVEGISSEEIKFTATTKKYLDEVKNIGISQSKGYVTLNWDKVYNADKYEIFVDVPNYGEISVGYVTTTNATLKGFKNNYKYGISIRAVEVSNNGNMNYGSKSERKYLYVDFNRDDNAPKKQENTSKETKTNTNTNTNYTTTTTVDQVKNLSIYNITKNSADISWSRVNGATAYTIYISKNYGAYEFYASTMETSDKLVDLEPNTYYQVKVEAYKLLNNQKYVGNYIVKGFTTLKNTNTSNTNNTNNNTNTSTKIEKVKNLKVEVKNVNEAYLTWWLVNNADGYDIYLAKENEDFKLVETKINSYSTILNTYALDYNTNYRVKVRAFKYDIWGKKIYSPYYSDVKNFKTGKYDKTQNSNSVGKIDKNSIKYKIVGNTVYLDWTKVYGAEGYEIDFTVPGLPGSTKLYSNTNSRAIGGITDTKYNYTARIRAYKTINGIRTYGPYSELIQFKAK